MGSDEARGRGHLQYPSVGRTTRRDYSPVARIGPERLAAISPSPLKGRGPG
jgi:hypothetical protein